MKRFILLCLVLVFMLSCSITSFAATEGENSALEEAQSILTTDNTSGFSKAELEEQLQLQFFETSEIAYALDNCDADFEEQALIAEKYWIDQDKRISKSKMKSYLSGRGFETSEITYALGQYDSCYEEDALEFAQWRLSKEKTISRTTLEEEMDGKYTASEITYAVKNCGVDFKKQALNDAKSLSKQYYSKSEIKSSLKSDGFTSTEIKYAIRYCGVDFKKQALKRAKARVRSSYWGCSKSSIIRGLKTAGFTSTERAYALKNCKIDFRKQALKSVNYYLKLSIGKSKTYLNSVLKEEGFIKSERSYALKHCKANFKKQAVKYLKGLLDGQVYSYGLYNHKDGCSEAFLKNDLKEAGFTSSEISYALKQCPVNYKKQAVKVAKYYKDLGLSKAKAKSFLKKYDGLDASLISYALKKAGY